MLKPEQRSPVSLTSQSPLCVSHASEIDVSNDCKPWSTCNVLNPTSSTRLYLTSPTSPTPRLQHYKTHVTNSTKPTSIRDTSLQPKINQARQLQKTKEMQIDWQGNKRRSLAYLRLCSPGLFDDDFALQRQYKVHIDSVNAQSINKLQSKENHGRYFN